MLLSETSQSQKDRLYKVPKVVTLMEVESTIVVVKDWFGEEMESYCLIDKFQFVILI